MDKKIGYFAVDRRIFDNDLFKDNPRWFFAWQWLLANAEWKDGGARLSRGTVELKRGQIASTIRILADAWGWVPSNVNYFLNELQKAEIIVRETIRTRIQTQNGASPSRPATRLTICNYDKYQKITKSSKKPLEQGLEQGLEHNEPQMFGFIEETPLNHLKQSNHRKKTKIEAANEKYGRTKPPHGVRFRDLVWLDYPTDDYQRYARDFLETRGADKLPITRIGGMGNWFVWLGEATRKKRA